MSKLTDMWYVSSRYVPVILADHPDKQVYFDSIEARGYDAGGGIALVHRKPGHGNLNAAAIARVPEMIKLLRTLESGQASMKALQNDAGKILVEIFGQR